MKVQALLAAATLLLEGALAQPTNHHAHSHRLRISDLLKKRNDDWIKEKDWNAVDYTDAMKKVFPNGNPTSAESTSTSAAAIAEKKKESHDSAPAPEQPGQYAAAKSTSKTTSKSTTKSTGSGKCVSAAASKVKRAELNQDLYAGDYTNNITPEEDCKSSGDYSLTFINNSGDEIGVWLWNKMSSSGAMDGAMKDPLFDIKLGKGEKTTFTFGPNSLYGFSKAVPRSKVSNMPLANIGEGSFEDMDPHNNQNKPLGLSFYDVSLVSYEDQKDQGAELVPMSIISHTKDVKSGASMQASTSDSCAYHQGQNGLADCTLGPTTKQPFHVEATFL